MPFTNKPRSMVLLLDGSYRSWRVTDNTFASYRSTNSGVNPLAGLKNASRILTFRSTSPST